MAEPKKTVKKKLSRKGMKTIVLISVGIWGAAAVAGFNFVHTPASATLNRLNAERNTWTKKNQTLKAIEGLQKDLQKFNGQGVETLDTVWLSNEMSRMADESGLLLVSIAPDLVKDFGDFKRATVRVELRGKYHQIGDFASKIENQKNLMKLLSLRVSKVLATTTPGELMVYASVGIYQFA